MTGKKKNVEKEKQFDYRRLLMCVVDILQCARQTAAILNHLNAITFTFTHFGNERKRKCLGC